MVYCHAGYWDHTLLAYIIHSLQGYPGELVRSLGTDIILDGIFAILDEHYNNTRISSNCKWARRRWCQSRGCICWGTSKFSWLHSPNAFCQITLLNWSMTASMAGCLSSLKWWHTSRQAVMRRHIQITSEWCGRLRRKRWWKHPTTCPWPVR